LLEAAEELKRRQPTPPPQRGITPPLPAPTPTQQRTVWDQRLAQRPMPEAAKKLTPKLKPIFAAQKVPPQLVWIAEVESSFDARAKSPAGAAGLFQIMKPTARSLGLSTWLPDERLNPEKSAKAAASYLKYLHGRFGDWRLALAAYNCGEGRVAELLKRSRTRTYEAIAGKLPAETQMYVPKIEATLRKREGVSLAELKMPEG
jgi:membrane-bound lytic murein transglycosylase D